MCLCVFICIEIERGGEGGESINEHTDALENVKIERFATVDEHIEDYTRE